MCKLLYSITSVGALLLGVAILLGPRRGSAETAAEAPNVVGAPPSGLEEIVVTARKHKERLQDVPVAVTALSVETLDRYDLWRIEQIAAFTPELKVVRAASGSGATLSLRGIGSSFTSIGIEQSLAVIVDGVYYGQGRIINEGFLDMAQVEILKGPQALFFGKNATAGVLSFTSADPSDKFEAMGRLGYEFALEQAYFEGVVSSPVADKLSARLAVRASKMYGAHIENLAPATTYTTLDITDFSTTDHTVDSPEREIPQEEDLVGRLTLHYEATDRLTLTLKASATSYGVDNPTGNTELYHCTFGTAFNNPGDECNPDWKIKENDAPADVAATNPILNKHGGRLYQDYDSYSFTGDVSYAADGFDFELVSGYHDFTNHFLGDFDNTAQVNNGVWSGERSEYDAFSTEGRVRTTFDAPVNFMIGGYVQTTNLAFFQDSIFPGGLHNSAAADPTAQYISIRKNSRTEGETYAGFGQLIWNITPDVELAAGARYTNETKDSFFLQPYVNPLYQAAFVEGTRLEANQSFDNWSPELTLAWHITKDLTVYGAYKEGFKSGGFSGSALYSVDTVVDDLTFNPETVEGVEFGLRAALFDNTLRFNATLYDYEYSDLQVDFLDAERITFITTNAAAATTRGVELEAEWAPPAAPGFVLRSAVAYSDAYNEQFAGAPCYGGQTPAEGCAVTMIDHDGSPATPLIARPLQDLTGTPTALAPKWTASVDASYETPIGKGLMFGVFGNVRYSDDYFFNFFVNPIARQESYALFDASLRFGREDGGWSVDLIGKNLTDKYYLTGGIDGSPASGTGTPAGVHSDQVGMPGYPRTISVQFTARY